MAILSSSSPSSSLDRRLPAARLVRLTSLVFTASLALLVAPAIAEAQFTTKPAVMMSWRSGKCARVLNGSTTTGTAVRQETCRIATGSTWRLITEGGQSPYFKVVAAHSGQCLAVQNGSTNDATPVVQNTCAAIDSQRWTLESIGQYYRLRAKHSNKCLNVNGNSEASGAALIQWSCTGGDNEILVPRGRLSRLCPAGAAGVEFQQLLRRRERCLHGR